MALRLLIAANSFYPSVGGYERVALLIARELHARGCEVKVVTFTAESGDSKLPFEVIRNPGALSLIRLLRWSDIYLQNNISLRLLWPLLFVRRPLVCVHHGFYRSPDDTMFSWRYRLKHLITLLSINIAVSSAVAEALPGKSTVCANPYSEEMFYRIPSIAKDRDLFFVGRLVSDKGVDLLIDAMAMLRDRGLEPNLAIAGSGPEKAALKQRTLEQGLGGKIAFVGRVSDDKLNELLNAHKIMVVPTRTGEGFGVVALEGIACGCVVVGSSDGGLPEAIGRCGRIFAKGDSAALADSLRDLLVNPEAWQVHLAHARAHLESHRPEFVVEQYLQLLNKLMHLRSG